MARKVRGRDCFTQENRPLKNLAFCPLCRNPTEESYFWRVLDHKQRALSASREQSLSTDLPKRSTLCRKYSFMFLTGELRRGLSQLWPPRYRHHVLSWSHHWSYHFRSKGPCFKQGSILLVDISVLPCAALLQMFFPACCGNWEERHCQGGPCQ